jgi:hypothetical protein
MDMLKSAEKSCGTLDVIKHLKMRAYKKEVFYFWKPEHH